MKRLLLFFGCTFLNYSCFAQSTNWGRIGQGEKFIVDVNLASVARTGDSIHVVSRFTPRSSAADQDVVDKKAMIKDPTPTFFKLVTGNYNCKTQLGNGLEEVLFDPNVHPIGKSNRGDGWTAEDEHKLILDFVCKNY